MTLEQINAGLQTTDIKGKPYVEIKERVKGFRKMFPSGKIITEILSNENGCCLINASIYDDKNELLSVAHAYEQQNDGFVNKTSYIENCETSAVGRALGFLGIGIDGAISSADEMQTAKYQQKILENEDLNDLIPPKTDEEKAQEMQIKITTLANARGVSEEEVTKALFEKVGENAKIDTCIMQLSKWFVQLAKEQKK